MGTQELRPTEIVGKAVKGIKKLKGSSRKIDDKVKYWRLGQLLNDINSGKYGTDGDDIAKNANYVMGLQIEYRAKYGDPGPEPEFNGFGAEGINDPTKNKPEKPVNSKLKPINNDKTPSAGNNLDGDTPHADKKPEKNDDNNKLKQTQPQKTKVKVSNKDSQNNNSNNQGLIINGNNNVILAGAAGAKKVGETEPETNPAEKTNPETQPTPEQVKQDIIKASKENYSAAIGDGKQVAKDLIGKTNDDEKANVIRTIMKQTKETIMGFIEGFNQEDNIRILGMKIPYGKGGLLDQIDNEGSWFGVNDAKWTNTEKNDVFQKVISTVLEWAKDMGFESDSNYISLQEKLKSLQNGENIRTEQTDKLINELISKGKVQTGV